MWSASSKKRGRNQCCNSYCIIFPLDTLHCWRFEWESSLPQECFVSRRSILHLFLFLERYYPGKVIMWSFFHLLSTSQYSSHSNHSGMPVAIQSWTVLSIICFVLYVTAVVAIQSQRNFYWNSLLLDISVRKVTALLICLS